MLLPFAEVRSSFIREVPGSAEELPRAALGGRVPCRRALEYARENNWPQPADSPPSSHASPGGWHVQRMFDSLQAAGSQ